MKFENCDVHDNTLIENAIVTPQGIIKAENVQEVQDVQEVTTPQTPQTRTKRKPADTPKITDATFRYRYIDQEDGLRRLALLYQTLIKAEWLDKAVQPDTFCDLFTGKPKAFTMKWTGKQPFLTYMIKQLLDRSLITCPDGTTHWAIAHSHFINSKSKRFTLWNNQKDPKKAIPTIDTMVNLLDPGAQEY